MYAQFTYINKQLSVCNDHISVLIKNDKVTLETSNLSYKRIQNKQANTISFNELKRNLCSLNNYILLFAF